MKKIGASLFLLVSLLLPAAPAFAANVQFSCWCQDTASLTCNHHRVDSGIPETDTSWTAAGIGLLAGPVGVVIGGASYGVDALLARSEFASRRDAITDLCVERCRADGGKRAIHFETSYREDICQECAADEASSCTEARGARVWSATHASSSLATIPQCPPPSASVFPVKLGVSIAGVTEVNGMAEYIDIAYRYLVSVVLTVAIIMVVWGGFKYLLGASMSSIQHGKETIKDALIGMVLVLGAYTILSTVNPATTSLKLPAIDTVACQNLDIPPAVASGRCNEDSDCASGVHCVSTQFVFRTDTDQVVGSLVRAGGGAGAEAGAWASRGSPLGTWIGRIGGTLGSAAGAGYYALFNIGGHVKMCSTGEDGSPCDDSQDCRPGLYCLKNWNLCTRASNIQRGKPCGELDVDLGTAVPGASIEHGTLGLTQEASCASGSECVRPAGGSWVTDLAGGDYKTCKGTVAPMFRIDGYVANRSRVPDEFMCYSNNDCGSVAWGTITGMQCGGPENAWRGKYCYFDSRNQSLYVDNNDPDYVGVEGHDIYVVRPGTTPCFRPSSVAPTTPGVCNGTREARYTCVYCPASGTRTWTFLAPGSEAAKTQIGVCQDKEGVIGTPCGR